MASALVLAGAAPFGLGVIVYYAIRVIKRPSLIVTTVLVLSACMAGASTQTGAEFLVALLLSLMNAGVLALLIIFLLRDNMLAYVFYGLFSGVQSGYLMLNQSAQLFQVHGWITVSLILGLALCTWAWAMRKSAGTGPAHGVERP